LGFQMLAPASGVADLFMAASLFVGFRPFFRIRADVRAPAQRSTTTLNWPAGARAAFGV